MGTTEIYLIITLLSIVVNFYIFLFHRRVVTENQQQFIFLLAAFMLWQSLEAKLFFSVETVPAAFSAAFIYMPFFAVTVLSWYYLTRLKVNRWWCRLCHLNNLLLALVLLRWTPKVIVDGVFLQIDFPGQLEFLLSGWLILLVVICLILFILVRRRLKLLDLAESIRDQRLMMAVSLPFLVMTGAQLALVWKFEQELLWGEFSYLVGIAPLILTISGLIMARANLFDQRSKTIIAPYLNDTLTFLILLTGFVVVQEFLEDWLALKFEMHTMVFQMVSALFLAALFSPLEQLVRLVLFPGTTTAEESLKNSKNNDIISEINSNQQDGN